MSIEEVVQSWRRSRATSGCIKDFRVFEKREGRYSPFPEFLHPALKKALEVIVTSKDLMQIYKMEIDFINPAPQYKELALNAPKFLLEKLL